MDRAIIATQVGRLYASSGVLLTFGAIVFPATFEPHVPPVTDTHRDVGDETVIVVKAPRALFGATPPRQNQQFNGADNRIYRIQALPSMPPSDPVIKFICEVTSLA